MYSYDRTALDLGGEAERYQRVLDDIRKKIHEARKMVIQAEHSGKTRLVRQEWAETLKGFDRMLDELDGM